MTATTLGDAIYLIGGCAGDQAWVQDPDWPEYKCGSGDPTSIVNYTLEYLPLEDRFNSDLPGAPHSRYRHAAAALGTKIFLFGGTDGSGSIVSEVDVFDTIAKTWATLAAPMPAPTTDLSAFVHGGRIYVLGGYTAEWVAMETIQIFNPTAQADAAWSVGVSMLEGRGDSVANVIGEKAYVVGGFTHTNNFESPLAGLQMLDLALAGAGWEQLKPMGVPRGDKAAVALNGILHVAGGESKSPDGHSLPLRDVEAYDPDTNTWYFGGDIPSERFRFTSAAHGDSMFLFGGQGFLVGSYGAAGSKYPVLPTVEAYSETVTVAEVSGSPSSLHCCSWLLTFTALTVFHKF